MDKHTQILLDGPNDGDIPLPGRKALEAILSRKHATNDVTLEEFAELLEAARWALHAIPKELDFVDLTPQNPINQVFFRAGLLACREYIARFVEQGGDAQTAASIRANWWPQLGDDPGPPRLLDFNECAEEHEVSEDGPARITSKALSPSVEALPRAFHFLERR